MLNLVETVKYAQTLAEQGTSKIDENIVSMEGMSGTKTRHFYNNLLSNPETRYLEIGTWKGSTLCASMCGNQSYVVAMDNWSAFGGPKDEFLANFHKQKGNNTAVFEEGDCFRVNIPEFVARHGKFNIYLFDGPHAPQDHQKALAQYLDAMCDEFVQIVDDYNWKAVRDETLAAIKDLGLIVKYEKSILVADNGKTCVDRNSWWNGIAFFVFQKR